MKEIGPPDIHHLRAADGWLGLRNPVEAESELAKISVDFRDHPDVLELTWRVHAESKRWHNCVEIGNSLVVAAPERPEGWIDRSYALHELKRTQEASDLLQTALKRFPGHWLMRYNLACYACQLGDNEGALRWLKLAMQEGDSRLVAGMASQDRDLEPLWSRIAESGIV